MLEISVSSQTVWISRALNYSEDLTGAAVLIPSCPTRVQLATSQETLVEQIILVGLWKAMNVEWDSSLQNKMINVSMSGKIPNIKKWLRGRRATS